METFLIKRDEPLNVRRKHRGQPRHSRPRIWNEDEQQQHQQQQQQQAARKSATGSGSTGDGSNGRPSLGGQSAASNPDEENTNDWSPEIPFENVRQTYKCFMQIHQVQVEFNQTAIHSIPAGRSWSLT